MAWCRQTAGVQEHGKGTIEVSREPGRSCRICEARHRKGSPVEKGTWPEAAGAGQPLERTIRRCSSIRGRRRRNPRRCAAGSLSTPIVPLESRRTATGWEPVSREGKTARGCHVVELMSRNTESAMELEGVSTKQHQVAKHAKQMPELAFTSLNRNYSA